jgi:hypothetical protein
MDKRGVKMFEDHTILGGWSERIEADIFNSEMLSSNGVRFHPYLGH